MIFHYIFLTYNYLIFQVIAGKNVAIKKDRNNCDCLINTGNNSSGRIMPTNKLLEKSGTGNKRNPPINPRIIDI